MKLICSPYLSCETNACSVMLLDITPGLARELLATDVHVAEFRKRIEEMRVPLEREDIELRIAGIDLQLFDDARLTENGADITSEWHCVAEEFEVAEDESTVLNNVGVRFGVEGVVFVFYPEHYRGSAESIDISYDELRVIATGTCPFQTCAVVEAAAGE